MEALELDKTWKIILYFFLSKELADSMVYSTTSNVFANSSIKVTLGKRGKKASMKG